jgi:short-subunit dehydrogenase
VYNASPGFPKDPKTGEPVGFGAFPSPANVDAAQLTSAFDVGVSGCVRFANHFMPYFVAQGKGSFLVSGATMGLRGAKDFACMVRTL